jgi:amino acid adenylation domain-containing protein
MKTFSAEHDSEIQAESIEGFRLSPQQKYLWTLQQSEAGATYRAQCLILIEGHLDRVMLRRSIRRLVRRHDLLRTAFHHLPGMSLPVQVIAEQSGLAIEERDMSSLGPGEQAKRVESLYMEAARLPFDPSQSSLLRASLIVQSAHRHLLLICLPSLCADSRTLENILGEISRGYSASLLDRDAEDEPVQFADLSEWQNELLHAEESAVGRQYWLRQNIAQHDRLDLPFIKHTHRTSHFAPRSYACQLKAELVPRLEDAARLYETSVAVLLLACWQVLVWRLTRRPDFILGVYFEGRNYEELEDALGLFAKYLPLRCQLEDGLSFEPVAKRTATAISDLEKWQDCFNREQLVGHTHDAAERNDDVEHNGHAERNDDAERNGDASSLPFTRLYFEWTEQPTRRACSGLSFSILKQSVCHDRFELKLAFVRNVEGLLAEFHFDSNLYAEDDVQRLAGQFQILVESVLDGQTVAIDRLEILSASERRALLYAFNETRAVYDADKCVHQLFEKQAAQTPEAVALVFGGTQLTYQELNARANQLAHYLRRLGVGPDVVVGLCVERSPEMIVGLLGILKAGGAYLPLDPTFPPERLLFMLKDAGVEVLLTQQHLVASAPQTNVSPVCLDSDWHKIAGEAVGNPQCRSSVENLVYVIYTSGSTGQPKGVAVEHRQLLNYLRGINRRLALPPRSHFATLSTFAADLGNTAIFPALCGGGGCLHLLSQEHGADPEALAEELRRQPIDCLKIVPSHLAALLSSAHPEQLMPRRCLVLGGEPASWDFIERLEAIAPGCRIINHYGPTETTVGVVTYAVEHGREKTAGGMLPLGQPLDNTHVYILDTHLQPVPIWTHGELYVGGEGVTRGYLRQPELTAQKFIPDPFSREIGARLYRTGDLARFLPDGRIEFLGRLDHQVKIRGFRIELGEIEAALAECPAVRQSVVVAAEELAGVDKRLVAYVVLSEEAAPSAEELRNRLKQRLPHYMIPSIFVALKLLPLTPNGKIDRRALPAPDEHSLSTEKPFVAPRNGVEETLASIWAEILHLERVGIHHDFFELGGHSLLVTQVVSRIRQTLHVELPLRSLFEHPTVAALSEAIEESRSNGSALTSQTIEPVPRQAYRVKLSTEGTLVIPKL